MVRIRKNIVTFLFVLVIVLVPANCLKIGTISVEAAPKKVELNKKKIKLVKGQSYKLKLKNNSEKIKWSSNKKSVVKVSSSGKITAKKKGTAIITAKVGKKKYKCKVIVQEPKINYKNLTIEEGDNSYQIKVTGTSFEPTFYSSDEDVIEVGFFTGKLKPISAGKAVIEVDINGKIYKCKVTVNKYSNTKIIPDCEDNITINVGETKTIYIWTDKGGGLTVNRNPASYLSVEWGQWLYGRVLPLTINAKKEGTTQLKIYDTNNPNLFKIITVNTVTPLPSISCDSNKGYVYPSKLDMQFRLDDYALVFTPDGTGTYTLTIYVTGECLSNKNGGYWMCAGRILDENENLVNSTTLYLLNSMRQGDKLNSYVAGKIYNIPMGNYKFQFWAQAGYCYDPNY